MDSKPKAFQKYARHNFRLFSVTLGGLVISIWTLIRFFDRQTTFDLVGQQILAHQWLAGPSGGAIVGPTNYIFKILFVYMPLDVLALPERFKLILMTIAINLVTYLVIVLVLGRLWRQFYPRMSNNLYLATLWLALISGSVYWIQFSNSRNLEVAGGLLLAYASLRTLARPSTLRFGGLTIGFSLLFFADSLQLYMTIAPIIVFAFACSLVSKHKMHHLFLTGLLVATTAVGYVGSKMLFWLSERIWNVGFLSADTHTNLNVSPSDLLTSLKQLIHLYVGGLELGRPVETLNLLLVAVVLSLGAWYAWKKVIGRRLFALVAIVWITDFVVYILSGQAQRGDTSRYMIMTAPFFVLLLVAVLQAPNAFKRYLKVFVICVVILNTLALLIALATNWNPTFSKDSHLEVAESYMKNSRFAYGYASMDTTLPVNYLSGWGKTLIPLTCYPDGKIAPSYLFFDRSFSLRTGAQKTTQIPVILDGGSITNFPATCNKADLATTFGQWKRIDRLADGSEVLIYDTHELLQH
ncbi:MAG: hypothetical protein ABJA64_00925 [Candidatus Saccharibacteria bacterium]